MIAPKILESLLFNSSSLLTIHTWRVVKFWWKNTNRWRLPVLLVEPVVCAIICLGYCESWYSSRFLVLLDVLSNMMAITMNLKFSFFFTIWTFGTLWPQIRITCGKYGHVPKDVFMTFYNSHFIPFIWKPKYSPSGYRNELAMLIRVT